MSVNKQLIEQARKCLAIQGIFLRKLQLSVEDEYDQRLNYVFDAEMRWEARRFNTKELKATDGTAQTVYEFFVECGLRFRGAVLISDEQEVPAEKPLLAELSASFAGEFLLRPGEERPSREALVEFGRLNVPFQSWSYWRELVQSSMSRAGLPNIPVPMFSLPEDTRHGTGVAQ
jgi:hypothetical protein